MSVTGVTNPDPGSVIGTNAPPTDPNNQLGQQTFLRLLTTQLSNQDPLAPQDQSQMLAQLAQFATVEGVNSVVSSQKGLQAANLLGKTVSLMNNDNPPSLINGKVTSVNLSTDGAKVSLNNSTDTYSISNVQQVTDTPVVPAAK